MEERDAPRVSLIDRFEASFVERCTCSTEGPANLTDHLIGCPVGEEKAEFGDLPMISYCQLCNKAGYAQICRYCWSMLKGEITARNNLEEKQAKLQRLQLGLDAKWVRLHTRNHKLDRQYGKSKYSLV
jgi:hypothetical protein